MKPGSSEEQREEIENLYGTVHDEWRPSRAHLPRLKEREMGRMSLPELSRELGRLKAVQLELARRFPDAFIEYAMHAPGGEPLRQAWFHEDWQEAIGAHRRLLIISPRGSGKTTQIVGRVIWELGHDPNLRFKIVCASDARAVERLLEIRQHLEENRRVREVFPHLVPAGRSRWTQHKLVVQRSSISRDASVEALGIGSSATGGRADRLIADDVVDRRNALQMPALRKAVKQAWFSDWTPLLEPEGRIIYICTLWTRDDLSHKLMENKAFYTIRYGVGEHFEAIWPEVWNQVRLRQRHCELGPTEFARAYRNLPQDTSQAPVQPDWIRYVGEGDIPRDEVVCFLSCDLATGEGADNDYFAVVLFGVHEKARKAYVMDAWHARLNVPGQVEAIKQEARHWKAEVIVETTGYQQSLVQFLHLQEPWLCVHSFKPRVSKQMRLERVTPHLSGGQVVFAEALNPVELARPERGDLVGELLDFPVGRHDDMVDAFSQGVIWIGERFLGKPQGNEINVRIIGGNLRNEDDELRHGSGREHIATYYFNPFRQ